MPADKAVRLFTRYVHEGEDPLTVGSIGLGLAVVRILAEDMGGERPLRASRRLEQASSSRLPASEAAANAARESNTGLGSLAPHIAAARRTPASDPYAEGITDEVA